MCLFLLFIFFKTGILACFCLKSGNIGRSELELKNREKQRTNGNEILFCLESVVPDALVTIKQLIREKRCSKSIAIQIIVKPDSTAL